MLSIFNHTTEHDILLHLGNERPDVTDWQRICEHWPLPGPVTVCQIRPTLSIWQHRSAPSTDGRRADPQKTGRNQILATDYTPPMINVGRRLGCVFVTRPGSRGGAGLGGSADRHTFPEDRQIASEPAWNGTSPREGQGIKRDGIPLAGKWEEMGGYGCSWIKVSWGKRNIWGLARRRRVESRSASPAIFL